MRLSKAARIEEAPVGFEASESAVALVGMDGFRLLAAAQVDGELHQLVETTAALVGCPECGVRAVSKGRRKVRVRDLPSGGRRAVVVWWKRIWRCAEPDCGVGSWTEQSEAIAPRASLTQRARAEACRQVGEQNRSVACVARDLGVGWATVMGAVEEYGRPLVDDPQRLADTTALGLDEVAFLRANAQRHTTFASNFVDLARGRLLDRPRAPPPVAHGRAVASGDPGPPHHRRLQRPDRGRQSRGQEGGPRRAWVPQLPQFQTAGPSSCWRGMAHSTRRTNQRALSPLGRVEPQKHGRTPG